jgi:hypothetical protein
MPELPQIEAGGGIQQPNYARPPIAGGEGVSGLREASEATENMITEMAVHVNDIKAQEQFNAATSDYANQSMNTAQDVLDDPKFRTDRVAASDEFMKRMASVKTDLLATYPMANRYGALAHNIDIAFKSNSRVIQHRAWMNDGEDTLAKVKGSEAMALANATNPLFDEAQQSQFYHDYIGGLIMPAKTSGLMLPGEADALQNHYMYAVNQKLFENYARANPGQVLAMQAVPEAKDVLPKWVMDAAPSSVILPEWVDQAKKAATEKLESTQKAVTADVEARTGALATQAIKSGTLDDWNKYMAAGGEQKVYESYTGQQWIRSNPELRDQLIGEVKAAKLEEIPLIEEHAAMLRGTQILSNDDMREFSTIATQQKKLAGTAEARAQKNWQDDMFDEFIPKGTNPMTRFLGSMTPKVDKTSLARDLNRAWVNSKGDRAKATELIEKQYAPYRLKGGADMKGVYDRAAP